MRYSRVNKSLTAASSHCHPLIGAIGHNVQQGLKRRASLPHTAILEILPGYPSMRFHNGIHTGRELDDILLLGTQHLLRE